MSLDFVEILNEEAMRIENWEERLNIILRREIFEINSWLHYMHYQVHNQGIYLEIRELPYWMLLLCHFFAHIIRFFTVYDILYDPDGLFKYKILDLEECRETLKEERELSKLREKKKREEEERNYQEWKAKKEKGEFKCLGCEGGDC